MSITDLPQPPPSPLTHSATKQAVSTNVDPPHHDDTSPMPPRPLFAAAAPSEPQELFSGSSEDEGESSDLPPSLGIMESAGSCPIHNRRLHLCRCRMHPRPYPPKNQFQAPDGSLVFVYFDEKDYPYHLLLTNEERLALDWEVEKAAFEKMEENLSDIEWEMSYGCNHLPSIDAINYDHFEWGHFNLPRVFNNPPLITNTGQIE